MRKLLILTIVCGSQFAYSQFLYETSSRKFCSSIDEVSGKWKCSPKVTVKTVFEINKSKNILLVRENKNLKAYFLKYYEYDKYDNIYSGSYEAVDGSQKGGAARGNVFTVTSNEIWMFSMKGKIIYQISSAKFK